MTEPIGVKAVFDVSSFTAGLNTYINGMKQAQDATKGASTNITQSMSGVGTNVSQSLTAGTVALGAFIAKIGVELVEAVWKGTTALVNMGVEATKEAGRVAELDLVTDFLGLRFGVTAGEIDNVVQKMKEYGIQTDVALGTTAQFIRYQLSTADALKLARVAQDSAVLSQENSTDALKGLLTGILTYNARTIRAHGVVVSLDEASRKFAKTHHILRSEMTGVERAQVALSAVLEQGARVAGLYDVAMELPSKRLRSMPRYFYELAISAGKPFQDAFGSAVDIVNKFAIRMQEAIAPKTFLEPVADMRTMDYGLKDLIQSAGVLTSKGGELYDTFQIWGAAAAVLGDELLAASEKATEAGIAFINNFSHYMIQAAQDALTWGVNIAVNLGEGLVQGAIYAITAAMEFISSLLTAWLAPGSPPKVAPYLDKWGAAAMQEWLRGFTTADFTVLDALENPLRQVFDVLADLGRIAQKAVGPAWAELSQMMTESLAETGAVSKEVYDAILKSTGEFGKDLVDLVQKTYALAEAEKEVARIEKELEALRETNLQAETDAARAAREYNKLARAGASDELTKAKMAELNAAEKVVETTEKQIADDEKALKLANKKADPMREMVALQQQVLQQLIEIARAYVPLKEPAGVAKKIPKPKAGKGAGRETEPLELPEMPSGGMLKSADKAFEDLKKKIHDKLDEILAPLRIHMKRWSLLLGTSWAEAWDSIIAMTPDFNAAMQPFKDALTNFQDFWKTNGAELTDSFKRIGLVLAEFTGTVVGAGIAILAEALKMISEVLKENGPEISKFLKDMADSSEKEAPTFTGEVMKLRDNTIKEIDELGRFLKGEKPFGEVLKDFLNFDPEVYTDPWKVIRRNLNVILENIKSDMIGMIEWNDANTLFEVSWDTEEWNRLPADIGRFLAKLADIFIVDPFKDFKKDMENVATVATETWDKVKASWNAGGEFIEKFWNILLGKNKDGSEKSSDEVLKNMRFMEVENKTIWDKVSEKVTDIWKDIVEEVEKQAKAVHDTIQTWMDKASTLWDTVWGSIKTTVSNILNGAGGIISIVTTAVTTIYNKLTGWIPDVISYFNDPKNLTSLATIGQKIIEGLVGGIVANYTLIKNAIIQAVHDAITAAKAALKIFGDPTPSLVFNQQLGKPIAEGVAVGIRDNAKLISSAMRDALGAKSMMASPMIASRGASSNYSYSTRNFNQNLGGVNINNGMDLAQFTGVMRTMIRQEIKR